MKPNVVETKPPPVAAVHPAPAPKIQPGGRTLPRRRVRNDGCDRSAGAGDGGDFQSQPHRKRRRNRPRSRKRVCGTKLNPIHWFGSSTPEGNYNEGGVTPLTPIPESVPATNSSAAPPGAAVPVKLVPPAPPAFPRYLYLSPSKPKAGDRRRRPRAFTAAQQSEQN